MKLSEMDTTQMSACLCKIAEPIARIGTDENMNNAVKDIRERLQNGTVLQKGAAMIGALVPSILGTHFDDMVTIVAVMTGKTEECVRTQKGYDTIRDIKGFYDEDFASFFNSSAAPELKL